MKLTILQDPKMPNAPILGAPGFYKKGLAHRHWEQAFRCAAGCLYCSTNVTMPMQYGRKRLMRLAAEQVPGVRFDEALNVAIGPDGKVYDPTHRPEVAIVWDGNEALTRLSAQLDTKSVMWGKGETLMVSQLTDPLIEVGSQKITRQALEMIFERSSFRVRLLTKADVAGREPWLSFFKKHHDRVVVGLSIGSLDDDWAAKMEPGTSSPTARVRALRALQDAGVPVFGMFCPVFPNVAHDADHLGRLLNAVRPELCESIWVEPANNRSSADAEREVYPPGSEWRAWYDKVYPPANEKGRKKPGDSMTWSVYATVLYNHVRAHARAHGWLDRLGYLLYEQDIAPQHAPMFEGFEGVLLQAKPRKSDGLSVNPHLAALQRDKNHGRARGVAGPGGMWS